MEFKDRLKSLRKEKKITQVKLGEMLNYGYTAIANYESGRNQPSISDLLKIAQIFNVSMDYLLGVNDIRYPYIKDDNSNQFNEFRRLYAMLPQNKTKELLLFMEWIIDREATNTSIAYETSTQDLPTLKVAEEPLNYTTRPVYKKENH